LVFSSEILLIGDHESGPEICFGEGDSLALPAAFRPPTEVFLLNVDLCDATGGGWTLHPVASLWEECAALDSASGIWSGDRCVHPA